MARTRILHRCASARLLHLGPIDELERGAGQASPPAPWRDVRLRKAIWDVVVGHNPAAVADALMTLLAHVIACNSRNLAMMGAALARNLALALEDDDDAEPLPN